MCIRDSHFTVHGTLLPGYTVEGQEPVKAEEHFLGVLALRKKTVKGFARNAAQGKIAPCLPVLRIKADER